MKLLAFVTTLSIYHSWCTQKTFWEEKFIQVNMRNCGHHNVRKHRDIKNGDQYVVLGISLKFGDLDKIKIKSSYPKYYLGRSGKGLIIYLGIKASRRSKLLKKYQSLPLLNSVSRIFLRLLSNLRMCLMRVMWGRIPNTCLLTVIST